uniref:PRMT5 TIM barrel domain-containing protein n=1 Tax=Plectus sambesii TaxID=2011161 RepID=A0A914VEL4_9BILA
MQASMKALSPPSVQNQSSVRFLRASSLDLHFRAWKCVSTLPEGEHEVQDQSTSDGGWNVDVSGTKYNYSWSKFALEGMPRKTVCTSNLESKQSPDGQELIIMQSQWIDPDSDDENMAQRSAEALKEELAMGCALSASAFVVRLREHSPKLCRIVNEYVKSVNVDDLRTAMK